jgi:hypothetical protein
VTKFNDVKVNGILHNRFDLMIQGDMRDYIKDLYRAEIISKNAIKVSMPMVPAWYLQDRGQFFQLLKKANALCERTQEAHDVVANSILATKETPLKHIILKFPAHYTLSTRYYSDHATKLKHKVVPMDTSFDIQSVNRGFKQYVNVIYWKVSVSETSQRIVERNGDFKTDGEKEIMDLLNKLGI